MGEMCWKKRKASKATDATMPMVVNTAMVEQPISNHSTTRFHAVARAQLRSDAAAHHDHRADGHHHDQHRQRHAARCRAVCTYSAAAARTGSLTALAGTLPATRLRTSLRTSDSSLVAQLMPVRQPGGH